MPGYPRENEKDKGFWDGGAKSHGSNKDSGGKASGSPGRRTPTRQGFRIDLEFPETTEPEESQN